MQGKQTWIVEDFLTYQKNIRRITSGWMLKLDNSETRITHNNLLVHFSLKWLQRSFITSSRIQEPRFLWFFWNLLSSFLIRQHSHIWNGISGTALTAVTIPLTCNHIPADTLSSLSKQRSCSSWPKTRS